ncbi:MAG: cupin domain-containing protein [Desulfomonile tiedjei]|nr:cupin domain-containing protein [Desulfomonile tiedjei]
MNKGTETKRKRKSNARNDETASEHVKHSVNRRSFLTGLTLVAGGALATPLLFSSAGEATPAQTPGAGGKETTALPDFRFPLIQQPARVLPGGSAREATAVEFPVSKNIAGVLMTLKPGGLRELHWHANAAEWAYVIEGNVRVTIVDPQGRIEIADFGPGDIWYFPRGHAHSIQGLGLGPGEAKFLLVFDNGYFSEFATFSFSDWLAQTPKEIVAKNLNVPVAALTDLPKKEVYIAQGPVPPPLPVVPLSGRGTMLAPPLTHKYSLRSQKPFRKYPDGEVRLASAKEFPISKTMTGALLNLDAGALRELHWHPNADEWQYMLSGKIRLTVFASHGLAEVVELSAGDIGFAPMGYGHALENVGDAPAEVLIVFNSGEYQEISLSTVLTTNPAYLLETNFNLPKAVIDQLPKKQEFITTGGKGR